MKNALLVALREVKVFLQDKADMAFSLLLPVVTFALIYGAFGGQGLFHGTAYIVDEDTNGVYAQQLVDSIKKQDSLTVQMLTRDRCSEQTGSSRFRYGVFYPPRFFR